MNKLLTYLKLQEDNKLSITNLALLLILFKVTISPLDYTGAVALIPVIALYTHKRHTNAKQAKDNADTTAQVTNATTEVTGRIEKLESTITSLAIKAGFNK